MLHPGPRPWFFKTSISEFFLPWPMTCDSGTPWGSKRTTAPNLIAFLPLVWCEGQTAHISLLVTHGDGSSSVFFLFWSENCWHHTRSSFAALAMIDSPWPASPTTHELGGDDVMNTASRIGNTRVVLPIWVERPFIAQPDMGNCNNNNKKPKKQQQQKKTWRLYRPLEMVTQWPET